MIKRKASKGGRHRTGSLGKDIKAAQIQKRVRAKVRAKKGKSK